MTHASVFSGIGGPEIAATMLGWENLFHCEINEFGRKVLDYWYPNSKSYEDITKTDFTEWRGRVDVLTGGFPCQPFSYAGRRKGAEDDRYLWPSMYRAIDEIQPTWVVAENVAGILTMVEQGEVSKVAGTATLFDAFDDLRGRFELRETFTLQRICTDLESHGYAVQPVLVPACAVGAPHRRDRVFIVARRVEAVSEDSMHCGQLHRQDEVEGSERNIGNVGAGSGERLCGEISGTVAADPVSRGEGTPRPSGCVEGSRGDTHQQPSERRATSEWSNRFYELLRHYPRDSRAEDDGGAIPSDTICIGRAERPNDDGLAEASQQSERRKLELGGADCSQGRWRQFPSVSPVHRGNDGLHFDVDSLTISFGKWRTEALKAYGNAIVPQVMYEIFRAIKITESNERI